MSVTVEEQEPVTVELYPGAAVTAELVVGQGEQGVPGAAATIVVGTVTTGAPGTDVEFDNVGTSSAAVFDVTIPQGVPGVDGDVTEAQMDAAIAAAIAALDAFSFEGAIDCSANPNYPAANMGHTYKLGVAGRIGGASGPKVQVGDMAICLVDGTAAGNQATVGANWTIIQVNIDGAVIGPTSATDNRIVVWDGTTGALVKVGTATIADLAPARLGSVLNLVTDWNTAVGFGHFYSAPAATNAPAALAGEYILGSFVGDTGTNGVQTVTAWVTSVPAATNTYQRVLVNSVWGSWYRLATTQAEQDARYAQSTGGGREKVAALSATTGTCTGDLSAASVFTITPTGNWTLAFSNVPSGVAVTVTVIVSEGATPRTMTDPSGTTWATGGAPTVVASKWRIINLVTVDGGTSWRGAYVAQS